MSLKPTVIYIFAAFYLIVLTIGWLVVDKVATGDYFAQSALVLTAIGLYNVESPNQ